MCVCVCVCVSSSPGILVFSFCQSINFRQSLPAKYRCFLLVYINCRTLGTRCYVDHTLGMKWYVVCLCVTDIHTHTEREREREKRSYTMRQWPFEPLHLYKRRVSLTVHQSTIMLCVSSLYPRSRQFMRLQKTLKYRSTTNQTQTRLAFCKRDIVSSEFVLNATCKSASLSLRACSVCVTVEGGYHVCCNCECIKMGKGKTLAG